MTSNSLGGSPVPVPTSLVGVKQIDLHEQVDDLAPTNTVQNHMSLDVQSYKFPSSGNPAEVHETEIVHEFGCY